MNALRHSIAGPDGAVRFAMNATGNRGSNFDCSFSSFMQTTPYSVSFWFRPNASSVHGAMFNYTGLYGNSGTGVAVGFGSNANNLQYNGNYLVLLYNTLAWVGGVSIPSFSGWHHYATVFEAGGSLGSNDRISLPCKQYFDGVLVKSYNARDQLATRNIMQVLGFTDGNDVRHINGQLTRLCMRLSKALTASEVAAEFAEGFKAPDLSGLDHYWDGTVKGGFVHDHVGGWHLSINGDASVVSLET